MELTTKKIISVKRNEVPKKVYDIQTLKNHNFFANNTLVHNCILYQESLQLIYHKLGGMPLDETDMVRKAFTKKDISNKEKAKQDREKLKQEFIIRCKEANNIDEKTSTEIFEEMEKYVSYSFNKSHAVAYSILSYQSAWLLTYHQDEWIASYIDYCATEKGKLTGKEDPKSIAIREAMKLGYKLGKADINWSTLKYSVRHEKDQKFLIPSFKSLTGIGETAAEEVMELRRNGEGYTDVYSLFMKKDGSWKHRKFTKSALASMIKIEALESMDLVGTGKLFENYRQLYTVAIDNFDVIKKFHQRKTTTVNDVYAKINELIEQAKSIEDWSVEEKKEFQKDIIGQYNISSTYSNSVYEMLEEKGIISIDELNEIVSKKAKLAWFFVNSCTMRKTGEGKPYLLVNASGPNSEQFRVFFWNAAVTQKALPNEGDIMVANLKKWDAGFNTNDSVVSSIISREVSLF